MSTHEEVPAVMVLGGLTVTPAEPDLFDADTIMAAWPDAKLPPATHHGRRIAVLAAAVAICWPVDTRWPGEFRPTPFDGGDDPLKWGRFAYSSLRKKGIREIEIIEAGKVAMNKIQRSRFTAEELDAALGKSEAPAAPTPD
jgi:hypothetical protein